MDDENKGNDDWSSDSILSELKQVCAEICTDELKLIWFKSWLTREGSFKSIFRGDKEIAFAHTTEKASKQASIKYEKTVLTYALLVSYPTITCPTASFMFMVNFQLVIQIGSHSMFHLVLEQILCSLLSRGG